MDKKELSRETCYKLMTYFGDNATPQNREFYNYFAGTYNKIITEGKLAVEALSILSHIKEDIADQRDNIYDSMKGISDELESIAENIGSDNQPLFYRKTIVSQMAMYLLTGGTKVYDSNRFIVTPKELKETVCYLQENIKGSTFQNYDDKIERLFEHKKKLVFINAQYVGLTDTISEVIQNGYPEQISIYSTDEEYEKEKQAKRIGRPLDSTAPQEKIKRKVEELVQEKRYQNNDGSIKPTPIRDTIMNEHPEIMGEISERTLFNRVKAALKNLSMQ